jgi:hypothetical protein
MELRTRVVETDLEGDSTIDEIVARFSPEGEKFLGELLLVVPDSTLPELVNHYESAYGVRVSDDTMGRALHRMGFSRKSRSKCPSYQNPRRDGGPSGL